MGLMDSVIKAAVNTGKKTVENTMNKFGEQYIPDYKPIGNTPTAQQQPSYEEQQRAFEQQLFNDLSYNNPFAVESQKPAQLDVKQLLQNTKNIFGDTEEAIGKDLTDNAFTSNKEKTNLSDIWNNPVTQSLAGPVASMFMNPQQAYADQELTDLTQNALDKRYNRDQAPDLFNNNSYRTDLVDTITNKFKNGFSKSSSTRSSGGGSFSDPNFELWKTPYSNESVINMLNEINNPGRKTLSSSDKKAMAETERRRMIENNALLNAYQNPVGPIKSKDDLGLLSTYMNALSPNSDLYTMGIENENNPLSTAVTRALNTRDYLNTVEGEDPTTRKLRNFDLVTSNPLTNLQLNANQWAKNNGFKDQNDISLPSNMLANLLTGEMSYRAPERIEKDEQGNDKVTPEKLYLMNDMRTAPRHSLNEYAGTGEYTVDENGKVVSTGESPYVEDWDFYLGNTPGGKKFAEEILDNTQIENPETGELMSGNGLSDIELFKYLAPDWLWEEMTDRVLEPYDEFESDDDGRMILRRGEDGRITREDMDRKMRWLNDPLNIFYADEALANPDSPTWFNFAGSSSDLIRHIDLLKDMADFNPYMGGSEYMSRLLEKYPNAKNSDEDFYLAAAMDLLGKQGGTFKRGGMDAPVFNALFERLDLPYRIGNINDSNYRSAEELGFVNPLKERIHYFDDDPYQLLEPIYNEKNTGVNGRPETAFFNRYIDTILANNPDYGVQNATLLNEMLSNQSNKTSSNQDESPSYIPYAGYSEGLNGKTVPTVSYNYGPNGEIIPISDYTYNIDPNNWNPVPPIVNISNTSSKTNKENSLHNINPILGIPGSIILDNFLDNEEE